MNTELAGASSTEAAEAAGVLRGFFQNLTAAAAAARGEGGLSSAAERDALATELLAGRRADAVLAHAAAQWLIPAEGDPELSAEALRRVGLAGGPLDAREALNKTVVRAALVVRTCARVRTGRGGDAAADLAAVELAEWDTLGALNRAEALDPARQTTPLRPAALEDVKTRVRRIVADLLAAHSGPMATGPPWAEAGPAALAVASQVLSAMRESGVLRWLAAARAARGAAVREAVRSLATEAAARGRAAAPRPNAGRN